LAQVITSTIPTPVPNLVQIRCWGLVGKLFEYLDFFWENSPQVRPIDKFSHLMAQTTCTHAKVGLVWVSSSVCSRFRGENLPKSQILGLK